MSKSFRKMSDRLFFDKLKKHLPVTRLTLTPISFLFFATTVLWQPVQAQPKESSDSAIQMMESVHGDPVLSTSMKEDTVARILKPKFTFETGYLDQANLNGSQGGFAIDESKFEVGNLLASFSYEKFRFHWHDIDKLPFGDGKTTPIKEMNRFKLFGRLPYQVDEDTLLLGGLGVSATYENEANDSLSYESFVLVSQELNAVDSWQLGGFIKYHPVQTIILPIFEFTFNYNAPDKQGVYGHIGFPKTQIGYHITPKLRTDLGAIYRQAIAKLADDSPIDASGFSQVKSWRGEWAAYYQAFKQVEFKLALKYTLTREWYSYDKNYKQTQHHYVDNAIGAGLGVIYTF